MGRESEEHFCGSSQDHHGSIILWSPQGLHGQHLKG